MIILIPEERLLCINPASINRSSMLLLRLRSFKAFFILSSRALTMSSNDLEEFKYVMNSLFLIHICLNQTILMVSSNP